MKARATRQPVTAELRCGPADNVFEITVSPVTNGQPEVAHLVHVMRDLSEHKKLEAELRQAQKMEAVGTLAGGIAHDFNNILMVIQSCAEILDLDAGHGNSDVRTILEATRRGASLARQLLLFSRKGAALSPKQPVNLNSLVQNVSAMLEKGLPKSVALRLTLASKLRPVMANAEQIEQVLMNLAVNAAHAMPAGGDLAFESQNVNATADFLRAHPSLKPGDYVQLVVSDTGHGMDQQTMERIYEPFFTTKKVGEGTGLGLSVAFAIMQDHAGIITCGSQVGIGTTFTIYLPAAVQVENEVQPAVAALAALPRGSETILVVDDEIPICRLVERHLTRLGYVVLVVHDGEAAVLKYQSTVPHPQAVILDLGMPKMSGWTCLEKLRQYDPSAKILIATGYGGDNVEAEARKKGTAALLAKPYKLAELAHTLRRILSAPVVP